MEFYRLRQSQDSGFAVLPTDHGLWATEELAWARAKQLEPNEEIRKYEFSVKAERVQTKLPKED